MLAELGSAQWSCNRMGGCSFVDAQMSQRRSSFSALGYEGSKVNYSQLARRVPGWMMVASLSGPVEIMPISTSRKSLTNRR